jgi:hypothetical protein
MGHSVERNAMIVARLPARSPNECVFPAASFRVKLGNLVPSLVLAANSSSADTSRGAALITNPTAMRDANALDSHDRDCTMHRLPGNRLIESPLRYCTRRGWKVFRGDYFNLTNEAPSSFA